MSFCWDQLSVSDRALAQSIVGLRLPDLEIAPDGSPYLYRWHVLPRGDLANVYLHVQVASDMERGLHDHPYANQSVILSGGYQEIVQEEPPYGPVRSFYRRPGDVIARTSNTAHRLILPESIPYTMTLFSTGPRVREWGFWLPSHKGRADWIAWDKLVVTLDDGRTVNRNLYQSEGV